MCFECDSKSSENDRGIYNQDCTESKGSRTGKERKVKKLPM